MLKRDGAQREPMSIKKILVVVLLAIILTSCTSAPTQTPNVTVTSKVTVTSAHTNTPIPTETSTPTPTLTRDPNVPADYILDADGSYTKIDAATGYTYVWDKERNAGYREYFYGSMWDKAESANKFLKDQLFTTVLIDDAIDGEKSLAKLTPHKNVDAENAFNWTKNFQNVLFKQMGLVGMFPDPNNFDTNHWYDGSHAFHFDWKNAEGAQQWGLWDGSTITIHISNNLDKPKMWTENGNLFIDTPPTQSDAFQWTEKDILAMFMFGPVFIMEHATYATTPEELAALPDLSTPERGSLLTVFTANAERYKLFDIESSP